MTNIREIPTSVHVEPTVWELSSRIQSLLEVSISGISRIFEPESMDLNDPHNLIEFIAIAQAHLSDLDTFLKAGLSMQKRIDDEY
jgi:hypothetical protein